MKFYSTKLNYQAPQTEFDVYVPGLICQSTSNGELEGLEEEEWTL